MKSKEIAERATRFACRMIGLHKRLVKAGGPAALLAPQLLKSAAAIGANLEEAAAGQTKADFIAKVCVSRKEARETVYWLNVLVGSGLVAPADITWEVDEANQLVRILTTIVINSRSSSRRG